MTIGSILLGLALLLIVILILARPFIVGMGRRGRPVSERQILLARKAALLRQIQELDFDLETNKILPDAYEQRRGELVLEAAEVLKLVDELPAEDEDIVAAIETAVANLRHPQQQPQPSMNGKTANFCPQCGQPLNANDKFCAHCGHKVRPQQLTAKSV